MRWQGSCSGVLACRIVGLLIGLRMMSLGMEASAFVRHYHPTTTTTKGLYPQRREAPYHHNQKLVLYHQHAPHEEERATLGDIMSSVGDVGEGLVTASSSSSSLAETYGIHHPLDRMALTANGNLQRMVSSYYDAPVSVMVESCVLQQGNSNSSSTSSNTTTLDTTTTATTTTQPQRWHRVVHLQIFNQTTFCTATSDITIYDPQCQELVASHQIGLGQLFRHLDILPSFELHQAGKTTRENNNNNNKKEPHSTTNSGGGGGGFWRTYTLHCAALSCHIHEEFCPGMWELHEGKQP